MRIFISYRRDDSAGYAGRLYDRLRDHFGSAHVFMDIDTIEPGVDFVEVVEDAVGSCDVLIALIGRQWLTITDETGHRRLDSPHDFVRLEVATALNRNIRVIPTLVRGAPMPRADELPDALAALVRRNAVELTDVHFHRDVDDLIEALEKVLGVPASKPTPSDQPDQESWKATTTAPKSPSVRQRPDPAHSKATGTPADLPMALGVGDKLGGYRILETISRSSRAFVYRAEQISIGRVMALRVLPAYLLHEPSFKDRFIREGQILARLEHPRILPVYDVGIIGDWPYVAMRYMGGGSLAAEVEQGSMALPNVIRIVGHVAEALDYVHKHSITHRDLKPTNVLLDEAGSAYVANVGLLKLAEEAATLTTESHVIGTAAYMAPELIQSSAGFSPAADIYALGVMAFQMLAGRVPYRGDSDMHVMMAHLTETIPDIREMQPALSQQVSDVLRRAMAKDPAERYQSAGEFAAALQEALLD